MTLSHQDAIKGKPSRILFMGDINNVDLGATCPYICKRVNYLDHDMALIQRRNMIHKRKENSGDEDLRQEVTELHQHKMGVYPFKYTDKLTT